MSDNMTGAELQMLREACFLSREDLAGLCNVAARTVKHWENGRSGVPGDVADLVSLIDATITSASAQGLRQMQEVTQRAGAAPADLVMLRYNEQEAERYRVRQQFASLGNMTGWQAAAIHGAIVNRLRLLMVIAPGLAGVPVRIVWMRGEEYEAWRSAQGMQDSETTRAAWAAGQVDKQAAAHRADQPPAHAPGAAGWGMA